MNYTIVHISQNTDQWKNWRRSYIGASDAASIMGVSPWKTELSLWEEKMEGKEQKKTFAMEEGSIKEVQVRSIVNEMYACFYKPLCVHSQLYPYMIASLDGWDNRAAIPLIEIKCPQKEEDHLNALKGIVPIHYLPQLQHQMTVMNIEESLYVSYGKEGKIATVVVKKDKSYCQQMIEKELEFYHRMLNFDPPKPTAKDFIKIEDANLTILARSYRTITQKIEDLEKEKENLRAQILGKLEHPRCLVENLKVCKFPVKGNIQYEKIPELSKFLNEKGKLDANLLDPYRGEVKMQWRITY